MTVKSSELAQVKTNQRSRLRRQTSGNFFKAVSAVVWKDLQAELRTLELFSAMLVFSLLIIIIFNFALELDLKIRQSVTSGVLWATFAFAGTLGLNRSMAMKRPRLFGWFTACAR